MIFLKSNTMGFLKFFNFICFGLWFWQLRTLVTSMAIKSIHVHLNIVIYQWCLFGSCHECLGWTYWSEGSDPSFGKKKHTNFFYSNVSRLTLFYLSLLSRWLSIFLTLKLNDENPIQGNLCKSDLFHVWWNHSTQHGKKTWSLALQEQNFIFWWLLKNIFWRLTTLDNQKF